MNCSGPLTSGSRMIHLSTAALESKHCIPTSFFFFFFLTWHKPADSAWINSLVKCTWDSDESSGTERRHHFDEPLSFCELENPQKKSLEGCWVDYFFIQATPPPSSTPTPDCVGERLRPPLARLYLAAASSLDTSESGGWEAAEREASHFNLLSLWEVGARPRSWLNANARLTLHGAHWALNWKWEEEVKTAVSRSGFFFTWDEALSDELRLRNAAAGAPVRPTCGDASRKT